MTRLQHCALICCHPRASERVIKRSSTQDATGSNQAHDKFSSRKSSATPGTAAAAAPVVVVEMTSEVETKVLLEVPAFT